MRFPIHRSSISTLAGAFLVGLGALVIVGWIFGIESLTVIVPGFVNMKFNTAAAFFFGGLSLCFLAGAGERTAWKAASALAAIPVLVIGAATSLEYLTGRSLGIDELVVRDWPLTVFTSSPGRGAPNTMFNFAILGLALLALQGGRRALFLARFLALIAFGVTLLAVIGYIYQANMMVTVMALNRMAIHTLVGFLSFTVGIFFAKPTEGFTARILGETPGGFVARRLFLPILLIPLFLGWLTLRGEISGLYNSAFASSLLVLASIFVLVAVTTLALLQLDRKEAERLASERERSEAAVQANTAAETSRVKSLFLANMSHEIRTPMNGVIGMTSLLAETGLTEIQREYVNTIQVSGEALLSLINEILDFSKIESGKMELDRTLFSLRESIEAAIDLFAPEIRKKGLEFAYRIEPEVPATLEGDPVRLRQILVNLIGNAVKFTAQGEIFLSVADEGRRDGVRRLLFSVADTGIGIPAPALSGLFESFQQVDGSSTRRYGGTGLGLAISKRLAVLMGGGMWVKSEAGKGSTFSFAIEMPAAASLGGLDVPEEEGRIEGRRILVVDDNATNRRILELQLREWAAVPIVAASAVEALEELGRGKFDAALLDFQMPDEDGVSLARKIRGQGWEFPLILLSSSGEAEAGGAGTLFRFQLPKPVKQAHLFDALRQVLGGGVRRPAASPQKRIDPGLAARHPLAILLAEDNLVNQKVGAMMLASMGYRTDLATNGREAVEAVAKTPYDLVLMDVQMPEMDGIEAAWQIRDGEQNRPRLVALTANALKGDREKFLALGFDDYLSKPLEIEPLVAVLISASARK